MKEQGRNLFVSVFFSLIVFAPAVRAFTLMSNSGHPAYWSNSTIHYRINSTANDDFAGGHDHSGTSTTEFAPIQTAFDNWGSEISNLNLDFVFDGFTNIDPVSGSGGNTVKWVPSGWTSLSFRPPTNALAVTLLTFDSGTGRISDADIYFNAQNFQWAVVDSGSEVGYIDVENIATHEIGHLIGLDHSSESLSETDPDLADATMYYAASYGETARRNPHTDDVNGVMNLYGSTSRSTPTLSSIEMTGTSSDGNVYQISGTGFTDTTEFVLTRNDSSISDSVSRYRTIQSSTLALVTFDVSTFVNGDATLVAFNDPRSLATLSTVVTGAGYAATSGGGGGGCAVGRDKPMDVFFLSGSILMALSILILRRQVKLRTQKSIIY